MSDDALERLSKRLRPAAGMLNTLGMSTEELEASLEQKKQEHLLELIPTLPTAKQHALLDASFEHIRNPEYEPIVTALLQHTSELPPSVIAALSDPERGLVELVPLHCRHLIWDERPELFVQETHGSIIDYTEHAKRHRPDLLGLLGHQQTRQRRAESTGLQQLLKLVGSKALFAALVNLLKEIYVNTAEGPLAMLRCDLTMVLHEAQDDARPASRWDGAHKLIWCMDACQRDGQIEPRMLKEMLSRLVAAGVPAYRGEGKAAPAAPAGGAPVAGAAGSVTGAVVSAVAELPELAFALSAPPSLQLIARVALERLEEAARAEQLPAAARPKLWLQRPWQDDPALPPLATLLVVGSYAAPLMRGTEVAAESWHAAVAAVLQRVMPLLCVMMVEDRMSGLTAGAGGTGGGGQPLPEPAPSLPRLLKSNITVAPRLALLYALRRLHEGDDGRACQLLPLLAPLGEELEPQLDFVAALSDLLAARPQLLSARLCEAALHAFLLPLSLRIEAFHLEALGLLERLAEPLQRLRAGLDAGRGSMLASVLLKARELGLHASEDEIIRQRWDGLQR